jgi:Rps23 Pro-64 3,4-dihydroxylase Tpa1-like proline 4-hydroxylase
MVFKFIDETKLNFQFDLDPYPHFIIDGFLKKETLDAILKEMDELTIDKSYYYGNQHIEKNKYAFKNNFDINLQELFKELNSDEFISILETNSKITNIIRNNLELNGAGVHKVLNEGFLCMHTDFEGYRDNKYGLLDRRLNLLLYMNPEWKQDYGGELCLYDKIASKITKKIMPLLNRCVIFFTPGNIHGHPTPLKLSENICRQSITTYYYTQNTSGKNLNGGDILPVKWYFDIK